MGYPNFFAAVDRKRDRIFVLSAPDLSALKINGVWRSVLPLSDLEIENYELITDLTQALKLVNQARGSLDLMKV